MDASAWYRKPWTIATTDVGSEQALAARPRPQTRNFTQTTQSRQLAVSS
jgi:hypothetical protein